MIRQMNNALKLMFAARGVKIVNMELIRIAIRRTIFEPNFKLNKAPRTLIFKIKIFF